MSLRDRAKNVKIIEDTNSYLSEPIKGLELCANIISVGKQSFKSGLTDIENILHEFMSIAQDDSNTTGVKTYTQLQSLKEDLINILNFPKLENHYTVAVGGSFSAGKSTFLNKVLGLVDILPTDTNPTTSISAYITKGKKENFVALNSFNNKIPLDKEAIQAISHAFNKKYKLSFSHILKLISIEQTNLKYDNLVFIDTPGYSKSDSMDKQSNTDENVAREHLRTTDFLIWLIDAQTPISDTDLKFIKSLDLQHPILVVLNKADKRIQKDIDSLVQKSKENLISHDILFYDVIGYSSSKDIEYTKTKNVIHTYLSTIASHTIGTKILQRATEIFKSYIDYYDSQYLEYKTTMEALNKMKFVEVDKEDEYVIKALSNKRQKQLKHIKLSKKKIEKLSEKLYETIAVLLQEHNINILEVREEYIFDKKFYEVQKIKKKQHKTFRFSAHLDIKDKNELLKLQDLNNIEGSVLKIKALGITVKISNIEADIIVLSTNIKEIAQVDNINDIFNIGDTVIVQMTSDKKCIVIK